LRQHLEEERDPAAIGHGDADVVSLIDLQVRMTDLQRPAVAEVADLLALEAVVAPANRDWEAGDRDGELWDVDDHAARLVVTHHGHQDLALLLVAVIVAAAEIDDVA